MIPNSNAIVESPNFIVLNNYTPIKATNGGYQSEEALEREFIQDLINQGYEYCPSIRTPEALLANVRLQIESLNSISFSDDDWSRFVSEFLDKANDGAGNKSDIIHRNYICDFTLESGLRKNIHLIDKTILANNKVQVINQFEQKGKHLNRYDVTILVNGLPIVQVELKRRGVPIREAFNQVHRYSRESFNSDSSLFRFIQVFVISNGTDSRYFANTTKRSKNSFDFTMNWARADNSPIKDLKDFTKTFFQKLTLMNVLFKYSVLDSTGTLLVMRPYQIAASERIIWKIEHATIARKWGTPGAGGYIWHTTGSGKTLTSFKVAQLAAQLDSVDFVFFVVDRQDLDYQTMAEYEKFSPGCVSGSENTAKLKANILNPSNESKIIVTTIQKLNQLVKKERQLGIYNKNVVMIFDECHRSQFGEAQRNIKDKFKKIVQFGFTGTPIFQQNSLDGTTTEDVFGSQLHSYVITDAIRDEKVLKFNVDYVNVLPSFADVESGDEAILLPESREALRHPERISKVADYIIKVFKQKTLRHNPSLLGFNAMLAVDSVDTAKMYYEAIKNRQAAVSKPLKIATIYSFAANEAQSLVIDLEDESFDSSALTSTSKEFLEKAVLDYNATYSTNFTIDGEGFKNYYRDISQRVKNREIDLLIVVGMFLTGFDAQTLNTLFVDKNLRYHGLIQAFSRTNRIYDATKPFGNIVTFRNLDQAVIDAITLFGDRNTKDIVLEKSFRDYLNGFIEAGTGNTRKGFIEIVDKLVTKFPDISSIETEAQKREFVSVFGTYLRLDGILQNYSEYPALSSIKDLDLSDSDAVAAFKDANNLSDAVFDSIASLVILTDRQKQDYLSVYNDIRDWIINDLKAKGTAGATIDWSSVEFEVELLKSQEINLDYILKLIFESNKNNQKVEELIEEIRRAVKASISNRSKEGILVKFVENVDTSKFDDVEDVIRSFYEFANKEFLAEIDSLVAEEGLDPAKSLVYLKTSTKNGFASESGTGISDLLPKGRRFGAEFVARKERVYQKIRAIVDKFSGVVS